MTVLYKIYIKSRKTMLRACFILKEYLVIRHLVIKKIYISIIDIIDNLFNKDDLLSKNAFLEIINFYIIYL